MTVLTDHHGLRSENFVGKINYYGFLVLSWSLFRTCALFICSYFGLWARTGSDCSWRRPDPGKLRQQPGSSRLFF